MTNQYNTVLKKALPSRGIKITEIPRLENENGAISASRVRSLIENKDTEGLKTLLPTTTIDYLKLNGLI